MPTIFSQLAPQVLAGVSFFGGLLEAEGIRAQGEGEAAAARYNARLAESDAAREEARIRREGTRYLASRAVAANKAGIAMEGTTLDALIADAETIEREAITTRTRGGDEARLLRAGAKTARSAGRAGAASAVLGSIGRSAAMYYQLRFPAGIP